MLGTCPDSDVVVFPELCVTGYTCADLFGQARLLDAAQRGRRPDRRGDRGAAANSSSSACRSRSGTACSTAPWRSADGAVLGVVPKQFLPNYKEFYESRWFSPAVGKEPAEIELGGRDRPVRDRPAVRGTGRAGARRGLTRRRRRRDLRGPLGAGAAQRTPGDGRGDGAGQPLGEQRDDRQEPVSHRPGRRPVGPMRGGLCDGRLRAVRVDDRRRLRRPLPDRRERRAAGRVAPGRRRPAAPPRVVRHHPGRGRRPAADRPPRDDQLRRQPLVAPAVPPRRRSPLATDDGGPASRRAGHAVRARRRAPSCTADAPRSSASSARGWPSGSSSSRPARR